MSPPLKSKIPGFLFPESTQDNSERDDSHEADPDAPADEFRRLSCQVVEMALL